MIGELNATLTGPGTRVGACSGLRENRRKIAQNK